MRRLKYRQGDEFDSEFIINSEAIPKLWKDIRLKYRTKINPAKSEIRARNLECTFAPMNRIHNDVIELEETRFIKDVYNAYSYFRNGDIVMAKVTPCFENGDIAVANNLVNGIGFGTTEITTLRPIRQASTRFIFYALQESHFVSYGTKNMTGVAGLQRISTEFIENYRIMLPTLLEQNRIAAFLDDKTAAFDTLIEKKEKLIKKLEEAKKSLISEVVSGRVKIVDGKMMPRSTEKMVDSGVEWLGMVPREWKTEKLKYISKLSNKKGSHKQGEKYIGLEHIESWTGKILEFDQNDDFNAESICNIFNDGDVLFGKLRPYLAKCAVTSCKGYCSSEIFVLKPIKMANQLLRYTMLDSKFIDVVNSSTFGVKMPRANWEFIGNQIIPIPLDKKEENEMIHFLNIKCEGFEKLISKENEMINKLKSAKQSLISEAVTGKIDLRDYEVSGSREEVTA